MPTGNVLFWFNFRVILILHYREAARKALEDVSKIEDIIEQAATRTTEAREAMQGADNNANLALSVAKDAEQIAIGNVQLWFTSCQFITLDGV